MAKKKQTEPTPEIILEGPIEETNQTLDSRGLGDTIKSITEALNIPQCDACKRRQEEMNKMFPWLKANRPIELGEIELMKRIKSSKMIVNADVNALFELYNNLFMSKNKLSRCNCPGLISKMIERIMVFVPDTIEENNN